MKKYLKKVLALLLVATSFTFLFIDLKSNSILTYAQTEQDQGIEEIFGYTHIKGTPFYIKNRVYNKNPSLFSKDSLNRIFENAKDKIYEVLGVNYTDQMNTTINVEKIPSYRHANGDFSRYFNVITIDKKAFSNNETLPHEMAHAFLGNTLGENYNKLNLGVNEGLATQSNKLGHFSDLATWLWLKLKLSSIECFANEYPSESWRGDKFYALHQYMFHDWIKAEGKDVVKKWLEKVKDGEDSVQAFYKLGGDKIVQKYHCTKETPEMSKFKKLLLNMPTDFLSFILSYFSSFCLSYCLIGAVIHIRNRVKNSTKKDVA